MNTKTLDERIRQRGQVEWSRRVKSIAQSVNQLTCQGEMRNQRMIVNTNLVDGKQVMTIWSCIERLFEAIEAAGAERAGDDAVTEFLKRFDDTAAELDELRSSVNQ
jgi:hypothetical protein